MARHVIERLHAEKEGSSFSEEPSLSDLVLVAQIIGQTSTIDRLSEMGMSGPDQTRLGPPPSSPSDHGMAVAIGVPMLPDLAVLWASDGWWIHPHPDFKLSPLCCQSQEELAATLQQLAVMCGQHRMPPPSPEPAPQEPE
jgi:hypothetical protein